MSDEEIRSEYRNLLTKSEQESQVAYDKAVLTLSGGALGLSFAFTKDVVGPGNIVNGGFLLAAWIGWGLSATSVLGSFFSSQHALRKAISELDSGGSMARPGGWFDWTTEKLNASGLILFLFGLVMMMAFLSFNLKTPMEPNTTTEVNVTRGYLVPQAPPAMSAPTTPPAPAQAPTLPPPASPAPPKP